MSDFLFDIGEEVSFIGDRVPSKIVDRFKRDNDFMKYAYNIIQQDNIYVTEQIINGETIKHEDEEKDLTSLDTEIPSDFASYNTDQFSVYIFNKEGKNIKRIKSGLILRAREIFLSKLNRKVIK